MKNILYYVDSNEFGGAEVYLIKLLQNLNKGKYCPIVVLQKSKYSKKIISQIENVKYYELSRIQIWLQLLKIFIDEKPDIIHLNMHVPFSCFWAIICAKTIRVPFVIATVHSTVAPVSRFFLFRLIKKILVKLLLPLIDKFICVSYSSKEELCANYFINPEKVSVIYNCVDTKDIKIFSKEQIKQIKDKFGIRENVFIVGTLTRLVKGKLVKNLIEAFSLFAKKYPNSICVIGGEGNLIGALLDFAKTTDVSDKILFLGGIEDKWEFLSVIDIFVHLSAHETFGMTVLDAMMLQKPVIVSAITSLIEIVENANSVILVDNNDINEIANMVELIYKNYSAFFEKAKSNQSFILDKFSIKNFIMSIEEIYDSAR